MQGMTFPVIAGIEESLPYFTAGIGIDYVQEDVDRPRGHGRYQWIQCRKGRGELFLNGSRYIVSEGQGMLLFPNEPHIYHSVEGDWKVDWVIFNGRGIGDFFINTMGVKESGVYGVSAPARLVGRIEELYFTALRGPSAVNSCSAMVFEILLDIMVLASKNEGSSIDDKFKKLEPVISYINENFSRPLSLAELADIAGITPQYLCSSFKRFTSRTVFEYINLTRIRRAKELLMGDKSLSVKEAALLSGFSDESYFCAMFRRYEKMSPLMFRNTHSGRGQG